MSDFIRGNVTNPKFAPTTAKRLMAKKPGRPVGEISVQPAALPAGKTFNYLSLVFTVDRSRKDYTRVVEQSEQKGRLPVYEQSLFNSCFANWGL